jgi:hypothetical protein
MKLLEDWALAGLLALTLVALGSSVVFAAGDGRSGQDRNLQTASSTIASRIRPLRIRPRAIC